MSFTRVPGSRKAESFYSDISTESYVFKLSYPGTSKSKVSNRFSDPNYPDDERIAGGLSDLRPKTSLKSRALLLKARRSSTILISGFRSTNFNKAKRERSRSPVP